MTRRIFIGGLLAAPLLALPLPDFTSVFTHGLEIKHTFPSNEPDKRSTSITLELTVNGKTKAYGMHTYSGEHVPLKLIEDNLLSTYEKLVTMKIQKANHDIR